MTFHNEPLDLAAAPRLDTAAFRPLDPAHLRLVGASHVILGVVVATIGGVATAALGWGPAVVTGLVLLIVVGSAVRARFEIRHLGWQVREHDVSVRRGFFVRTVDTLPFARVQHARIERGPLQRAFGVATVHVNSAGPDLRISGLSSADAEALKALVVDRAGALEAEVP